MLGLAYLHNKDVPHGNLKAANVFVSPDGSLKIADFSKVHARLDKQYNI